MPDMLKCQVEVIVTCYSIEKVDHRENIQRQTPRPSVYKRLNLSTLQDLDISEDETTARPSVFKSLGALKPWSLTFEQPSSEKTHASVFSHLEMDSTPTPLMEPGSSRLKKKRPRGIVDPKVVDTKDVHSIDLARVKKKTNWVVTTGESLKAKKHTVITAKALKKGEGEDV